MELVTTTAVTGSRVRADRPPRVLVAEDDPDLRELLVEALERDGFEVAAVGGTVEAELEMLIAAHAGRRGLPAVILTDRRMPDGDGLELATQIRRQHWWIPIVVLTAFADDEVRRRARAMGCCRVLSKPVDMDVVRQAVRQSLVG